MKKLISVMLVLCMVMALVPAMAFAAGTVAMVGETGYGSVQEAIDAASAPDAKTNRVDLVADWGECSLVIKGNVVLQLNGHTLSGVAGTYSKLPVEIVGSNASLTVQGPGTIESDIYHTETLAVLANGGKLILDKLVKVCGVIVNSGDVTMNSAEIHGFFDNAGTVTVNGGGIYVPTGHSAFEGKGKVTFNNGAVYGALDNIDSCPGLTVVGGEFNDVHVVNHTSSTVAGVYDIPGLPVDVNGYALYWVSDATMMSRAAVYAQSSGGTVDFLFGDAKLSDMPGQNNRAGAWSYWDSWDSYFNSAEDKQLGYQITVDGERVSCDGRGLVNSRSDLNITASKHNVATSGNQIADSVMNRNAQYVESVKAVPTGVNKNEVFYNIEITVDLDKVTEFEVPEGFSGWGNKNGSHQWVPITLKFTDLNGLLVDAGTKVVCRDAWNTAFTYQTGDDGCFHIWVGIDHVLLGSNSSFDFADMRYGNHGLIYRCTIVVKDKEGNVPENSEPDDTTGAAPIPSDKPAASGSTNAPSGTGNGDGPAKTGDNSTVMLWATLMVASAAGVAICIVDEAKKRSHK